MLRWACDCIAECARGSTASICLKCGDKTDNDVQHWRLSRKHIGNNNNNNAYTRRDKWHRIPLEKERNGERANAEKNNNNNNDSANERESTTKTMSKWNETKWNEWKNEWMYERNAAAAAFVSVSTAANWRVSSRRRNGKEMADEDTCKRGLFFL